MTRRREKQRVRREMELEVMEEPEEVAPEEFGDLEDYYDWLDSQRNDEIDFYESGE